MDCIFYFTFALLFAINNILMKSFIFFLALFCELTLSAQAQYTVKGFVHNASLEGIPKVAIKVLDADTNLIVSEPLTGTNGLFSFTSSPRKLRIYIESTGDYLSYWWNLRQNTELQLQHSVKKGILRLGYNHQLGHYAMDYGSERLQNGLRYESPTDIFHTQRWDSESHLPNLDLYAYGNSESRQLKLNLTYQFGKAKEAHVNELEEVQRL